jgi:Kef-type K+ transport system membrane component KefB
MIIATAFSATSVAVSVSVWDEMRKLNTTVGQLLVDVAELDDLSGVLLLALLLAIIPMVAEGDVALFSSIATTSTMVMIKLTLFIAGCYLFSHYMEARFTGFSKRWADSKTGITISVLGAGLGIAAIAGQLGFSLAIGAMFAGLAFSRDPDALRTEARFSYFHDFLAPFFFIHIGMQVDPTTIIPSIGMAVILFIPAVLGKMIGVGLPALRILDKRDALLLGVSMVPRAEIAMIIIYQFSVFDGNIVPDEVFAALVMMAIMTSVSAPVILRAMLAR